MWHSNGMFSHMFKAELVALVTLKVPSGSVCCTPARRRRRRRRGRRHRDGHPPWGERRPPDDAGAAPVVLRLHQVRAGPCVDGRAGRGRGRGRGRGARGGAGRSDGGRRGSRRPGAPGRLSGRTQAQQGRAVAGRGADRVGVADAVHAAAEGGDREREERGDAAAHFFFSKKKNTKKAYLEEDGVADWPVVAVDPAGAYQVGALGQLRQAVVGRLDDPGGGDNLEPGVAGGGGEGESDSVDNFQPEEYAKNFPAKCARFIA